MSAEDIRMRAEPLTTEQLAKLREADDDAWAPPHLLKRLLATVDALMVDRARFRDAAIDEEMRVAKIRAAANDERNAQERENAELRIALREARAEIDRLRAAMT